MRALKITQLAGVLILLIGVVMLVGKEYLGTLPIILGTIMYAVGRVGVWMVAKP